MRGDVGAVVGLSVKNRSGGNGDKIVSPPAMRVRGAWARGRERELGVDSVAPEIQIPYAR